MAHFSERISVVKRRISVFCGQNTDMRLDLKESGSYTKNDCNRVTRA